MINTKQISSLVEAISNVIPEELGILPDNAKKNFKATLSSMFMKMDLVSREEFDIQTNVLAKTRKKLEVLEQQVSELELTLTKK